MIAYEMTCADKKMFDSNCKLYILASKELFKSYAFVDNF